MGAGIIIAIIGGIVLCGVNSRYWHDRSNQQNAKWGPYRQIVQSALACGVFAVIRAAVSIVAIVMLLIAALVNLPRLVVIALAAVSAGLFLGEVISGGICLQRCQETNENGDYVKSKARYFEDSSFTTWMREHDVLQAEYQDITGTGTSNQDLIQWVSDYQLPTASYWSGNFRNWNTQTQYSCVIDSPNSSVPTYNSTTKLYDCDNFEVLTVKCVGGWNQDKLNSAIKSKCELENKQQQLTNERDEATSLEEWRKKDKEIQEYGWSRYKYTSDIPFLAVSNCILLVLQGLSFILTVVGIGLYAAGGH